MTNPEVDLKQRTHRLKPFDRGLAQQVAYLEIPILTQKVFLAEQSCLLTF